MMGQGTTVNGNSTPASPGTQARDQERFSLLLDINSELLYEAMFLKHGMGEIRKELASSMALEQQEEKKKEEAAFNQDFTQYVNINRVPQAQADSADKTVQCFQAITSKSLISSKLDEQQNRRGAPTGTHVSFDSASQPELEAPTTGGGPGQR